ncbi:MAG: PqqD family protein [Lachnospiraceae bacterium]|nr:PqqD family protein [Lachnospiraceae bacterium]
MSVRYRIRKAAGSYWLLDMEQPGDNYIEPIELNESGARIWELASQGFDAAAIAEDLAEQYGIDMETVKEDVMQFLAGLEAVGVSIGVK